MKKILTLLASVAVAAIFPVMASAETSGSLCITTAQFTKSTHHGSDTLVCDAQAWLASHCDHKKTCSFITNPNVLCSNYHAVVKPNNLLVAYNCKYSGTTVSIPVDDKVPATITCYDPAKSTQ